MPLIEMMLAVQVEDAKVKNDGFHVCMDGTGHNTHNKIETNIYIADE